MVIGTECVYDDDDDEVYWYLCDDDDHYPKYGVLMKFTITANVYCKCVLQAILWISAKRLN